MIYEILVLSIFVISTIWIAYQSIQVKHFSWNQQHESNQLPTNLMIRSHARLLLVLVLLWWTVYLLVNLHSIQHLNHSVDLLTTIVIVCFLTPLFSYIVCYGKHRLSHSNDVHYIKSCSAVEWTLNILTALIYASIINYSIQMIFTF